MAEETWTCTVTASDGGLSTSSTASIQLSLMAGLTVRLVIVIFSLDLGDDTSFDMMLIDGGIDRVLIISHDYYIMTTEITQSMFLQLWNIILMRERLSLIQ